MKYPYTKQWIDESDVQAVTEVLRAPLITRGPKSVAFEEELAGYCGASHAVVFSSGTAALHAAYFAAKVTPFDRLLTAPNSYIGTITGALLLGVQPTFVDIDATTGAIDLGAFLKGDWRAPSRGKLALVPVHFAGHPLDMCQLSTSCKEEKSVVIEDAAHALGARYVGGERVGCCHYSDMTVFSLHPAKTITTGEGGVVLTNQESLAQALRAFRNNGVERDPNHFVGSERGPWVYEVQTASGNFHMTELQAALGLSQLQRLDQIVERRAELASLYRQQLSQIPHTSLLRESEGTLSAHHLMVILIDFEAYGTTRTEVMQGLHKAGIGTQVHYIPLYRHAICGGEPSDYPQSESYYARALTLPLYYSLTENDITEICSTLVATLEANRKRR